MNKLSATKSQSFSLMRKFESMYGDNTANYYKALLNALYNKQIIPSVIVGGGLKNPVGVAERYLKEHIAKAERAGNIGQGNVTVSKPAKPTHSETDGYFYFCYNSKQRTIYWIGWTPTHRGADRAANRASQLVRALMDYGDHYTDDLQEKLNSNRKLSKLPAEKKSIASKGYFSDRETAWIAADGSLSNARGILGFSTEHLTRKEMKIFDRLAKLVKSSKQSSGVELRNKVIRLAHSKPELRQHLIPLVKKEAGPIKMKVTEGYPYIRYRIENRDRPTARCMVVFTYRVGQKSVVTQSLISDLNEFEKQCFSMTKSLERLFKMRDLGTLTLAPKFVRVELGNNYPLLGKYSIYFDISNDKISTIEEVLEAGFGATDIRS